MKDIDLFRPDGKCVGGEKCEDSHANDFIAKGWKRDNPNDCIDLCRNTPTCTHFVWVSPENAWKAGIHLCVLKEGQFETKEVKGVTSGYFSSSCGK